MHTITLDLATARCFILGYDTLPVLWGDHPAERFDSRFERERQAFLAGKRARFLQSTVLKSNSYGRINLSCGSGLMRANRSDSSASSSAG